MDELKELSLDEMQALDGGGFWEGLLQLFFYEVINDWGGNVKAFKEGYASFK